MQELRNTIHRLFRSLGWEVARVTTHDRIREADAERRRVEQWRLIKRYSPQTVLDIGANEGQFVKLVRQLLPDVQIHSFEPLLDCRAALDKVAESLPPVMIHGFALGNETCSTVIHRNVFSPSSSLLAMEELHRAELPHTAKTIIEEIEVRRLDDLSLSLAEPIFVKVDVQGYEMQVLLGGMNTIRRAKAVVVEISSLPLYVGAPTYDEIYRFLTVECGFIYRGNVDQWVSPNDGRILQLDCLFEKP